MATLFTLEPRRWRDEWSFSGRGRKLYAHARPWPPVATTDLDGPPREETPATPPEVPRG